MECDPASPESSLAHLDRRGGATTTGSEYASQFGSRPSLDAAQDMFPVWLS
jgi:hypothetical protein